MTPLPFHVLSDGWTEAPEAIAIQGGAWNKKVVFHATAFLLEHPKLGCVLVDTGYSHRFFRETRGLPASLYRRVTPVTLTEEGGIKHLLQNRGVRASDVRHIILTHFHADHAGGLLDFPAAKIYSSLAGWNNVRRLRGWGAVRRAFLPGLMPSDIESRLCFVQEGTDVLGDGSLSILELPGHAVGQIGVQFVDATCRPVLLAADACWLSDSFRHNRMPHQITRTLHQWKEYRTSLQRLHDLHHADPNLLILPSHCPETAERLARE